MAETRKKFGDTLIDEGILSREELDDALEKSKARNLSLEDTLFKLGYISRDRLSGLLAGLYGCDFIDLYSIRIDGDAIGMIPPEQALELRALPYAIKSDTLSVAVAGGSIETRPLDEIERRLERLSGKKIEISLCNPGPLDEMLMRFCRVEPKGASPALPASASGGELANIIRSLKSEPVKTSLREQFDDLYDIGQTALIGARSHPFSRAVVSAIDDARARLDESKKYVGSGFEEEAIEMARQAVALIKEATARADAFESDWEKLLQEVKRLRSKIAALEGEGAADFAPTEFGELVEIRQGLLECVGERNVDKLRSLLDQGMVVTEQVGLLEPGRSSGRQQVIASLAQVREVISRARNAGAKEHAPDALKDAYEYLDKAEAYARHAHWGEVKECLSAAESKAQEAERLAVKAAEEKKHLTARLRESIRTAMAVFERASTHEYAHEVIENLMRAKDVINETKACFDSDELERGIGLAENISRRITEEIIPLADEAERLWTDLFARGSAVSAKIQRMDIPLAFRVDPDKMTLLFRSEREMVASLCERNREGLAEAVTICEGLAEQTRQRIAESEDVMHQAEIALEDVNALLVSVGASGIDEIIAPAYEEARRLLDEARSFFDSGDVDAARSRAQAARVKIESEVIGARDTAQREWNDLSQKAIEVSEQIQAMNMPVVLKVASKKMELLFQSERDMIGSLSKRDRDRLAETLSECERLAGEIRYEVTDAREILRVAESEIEETTRFLATAAASGIDEKVAPAYDESRRMLEESRNLLDRGDAQAALESARTARVKLETQVIGLQDSIRRRWIELSHKADAFFGKMRAFDIALALRVIPQQVERLFEAEREMAMSLCERDSEGLAKAVSICEELAGKIEQVVSELQEGLRRSEAAATGLFNEVDVVCSADAMNYCPELVKSLRAGVTEMVAIAASGDPRKLDDSIAAAEQAKESVETTVKKARTKRHRALSKQLEKIEEAVEQAVQKCSGGYSSDILEDAYLDINRIKEGLSTGPEAMSAETAVRLERELAVAQTKVMQVEFMHERIEREHEATMGWMRLKLSSTREEVDACAALDFVDESSAVMQSARRHLKQVENLIVEGEIEESFEQLHGAATLAERMRTEAAENEAGWRGLADRLAADDAPHKAVLSDPASEKVAAEEHQNVLELDARTQSIVDSKNLGALEEHAEKIKGLADTIAERVEAWKKERRAQIEAKLADASREVGLADVMGAKKTCRDAFDAAETYLNIAKTYLTDDAFDAAESAADDALSRAREAGSLAKAGSRRESALALDYMKIASAHMIQDNLDGAREALERGRNLAKSAGGEDEEESPAGETRDEEEPSE